MSTVAVVGGHGKVAVHLHAALLARGHTPVPLGRSEEKAARLRADTGLETRFVDIEASGVTDFAAAFAGCDAVVFSAGGGPDGNIERKRTVDLEGAVKSIEAARTLGIARYVQVSAIGVDEPVAPEAGEVWAAYVAAKRDSDAAVRASGLDWTVVRPGRLLDEPATGRVAVGVAVPYGDVPRADVAAVLAAVLDEPRTVGQQFDLVSGDQSIDEALRGLGG
jgi:uncharacterized protein YbjT (DUF2867 family)